ncbi:MAG: polysaccharide biosynthesis protein [Treponema sp.]|nr:polysaccharide biosynthesis protein [Treponema sp.]
MNKRIYIIGAGFAGQTLALEIRKKAVFGQVAAFLDDDVEKIGRVIDGAPVLGPVESAAQALSPLSGDEAIIAMPSTTQDYQGKLYAILRGAGFQKIRILPAISQIIQGDAHLIQTRAIDPQDLLGRAPVPINLKESLAYLRGKRVLITGAGGSIGSELCRQLLSGGAERLYLFGHGENAIYQIDRELRLLQEEGVGERASIVPVIGDLKDAPYINFLLSRLNADVVFHAAAYKHVPLMEENPVAAVQNNLFGAENLLKAAQAHGVKRFVHITTDKAVEPRSVYGMSKYLCERLVAETASTAESGAFMAVRFGNVLGSRGSIIPLFEKQIAKGGPVTVTHPDMKRWFMSIPEACSLTLKVGGVGENGRLYLLDMGDPVKIRDVAEQMIRFYGFEPDKDVKIVYTGVRPGEKLDEKLVSSDEKTLETGFNRILRVEKITPPTEDACAFREWIERLRPICYFDEHQSAAYRDAALLRETLHDMFNGV